MAKELRKMFPFFKREDPPCPTHAAVIRVVLLHTERFVEFFHSQLYIKTLNFVLPDRGGKLVIHTLKIDNCTTTQSSKSLSANVSVWYKTTQITGSVGELWEDQPTCKLGMSFPISMPLTIPIINNF